MTEGVFTRKKEIRSSTHQTTSPDPFLISPKKSCTRSTASHLPVFPQVKCSGGGIGRHARLRGVCRKVCGFKSRPEHHASLSELRMAQPCEERLERSMPCEVLRNEVKHGRSTGSKLTLKQSTDSKPLTNHLNSGKAGICNSELMKEQFSNAQIRASFTHRLYPTEHSPPNPNLRGIYQKPGGEVACP